jgi:hypothetical protein
VSPRRRACQAGRLTRRHHRLSRAESHVRRGTDELLQKDCRHTESGGYLCWKSHSVAPPQVHTRPRRPCAWRFIRCLSEAAWMTPAERRPALSRDGSSPVWFCLHVPGSGIWPQFDDRVCPVWRRFGGLGGLPSVLRCVVKGLLVVQRLSKPAVLPGVRGAIVARRRVLGLERAGLAGPLRRPAALGEFLPGRGIVFRGGEGGLGQAGTVGGDALLDGARGSATGASGR